MTKTKQTRCGTVQIERLCEWKDSCLSVASRATFYGGQVLALQSVIQGYADGL